MLDADKAVSEPHGGIGRTADRASEGASVLTTRELEVLRLVAAGLNNPPERVTEAYASVRLA